MADINLKLSSISASIKNNVNKIIEEIEDLDIKKGTGIANAINHNRKKITVVKPTEANIKNISDFVSYIDDYFKSAKENNSALIIFPQYFGLLPLKITSNGDKILKRLFIGQYEDNSEFFYEYMSNLGKWNFSAYINTFSTFAKKYKIDVVAGSVFVNEKGKYYNRSFIFNYKGEIVGTQDKLFLTSGEKRIGLSVGNSINTVEIAIGNITLLNDNDLLFFETGKIAKNKGAEIIISSNVSKNAKQINKFNEALKWRCEEQNLFGISTCYSFEYVDNSCLFVAPAVLTPSFTGEINNFSSIGAHTFSINMAKLNNKFDPYTSDKNYTIYNKYIRGAYLPEEAIAVYQPI